MALDAILAHMHRTQRQLHGVAIVYERGTSGIVLTAVRGETLAETVDALGVLETVRLRDFLVEVAELAKGNLGDPQEGDRIKEQNGARFEVFEVMAIAGEPPWRYSDPERQTYRIHTKHVDTLS